MTTRKELITIMRDELKARGYSIDTQAAILGQFKKEMQFAPRYATQPEARSETSANTDYANKNGNTEKGDGYKYRGRSYIQLTGRGNYKKIGEELFLDGVIDDPDALVNNPDLLLDPVLGAKASIAYLNSKSGFKEVIEQPDLNKKSIALTKLINPGLFKEQKDFYLPENTKKNVLLNEGKNLRHKDNKGNRTGITFQEDINFRTKYSDDFRKQLELEKTGFNIDVDGDFGKKSKEAWKSYTAGERPNKAGAGRGFVNPEFNAPAGYNTIPNGAMPVAYDEVPQPVPQAQPTYDYIPQQPVPYTPSAPMSDFEQPQYATMEDLLADRGLMGTRGL
jgi:predicted chitinase